MDNPSPEQIKAVILGHATADALGVPVEFQSRKALEANPVTGMRGFGTYPYPAGCWSDDTSMTLCALESLGKGKIDYDDIMVNFGRWYYRDEFTPTGKMFDIGSTCSLAIDNYIIHHKDTEHCGLNQANANGNGSLMRILPFALYLAEQDMPVEEKIAVIHRASALTHAHERSKAACGIYSFILWELLKYPHRTSVYQGLRAACRYYRKVSPAYAVYHERLFRRIGCLFSCFEDYTTFRPLSREEIKSSGYVVDTLEASVWCLLTTQSYRECVLAAVNLGEDTDTVAAVAGGLAGALYGMAGIPEEWLKELKKREWIEDLCERFSTCL